MDAAPLLAEVGRRINEVGLEAILIGNAAAALRGAPVTTVDFDFLFRRAPRNISSTRAAGRPRDVAVLEVLETALEEAQASRAASPPRRTRARKPPATR